MRNGDSDRTLSILDTSIVWLTYQTAEASKEDFESSQPEFSATDGTFETATVEVPAGSAEAAKPLFDGASRGSLMIFAGVGILVWLLMRGRMGRRKRYAELKMQELRFNGNAKLKPIQFNGTKSLGAPADILNWQLELHDLGRELKGELDSKMLAVQNLTRQYDQAAQRLSELIKMAEQVEQRDELAGQNTNDNKPAATASASSVGKRDSNAAPSPFAKARQLQAAGWPSQRIANCLGMPAEDIELLLSTAETVSIASSNPPTSKSVQS